MGVVGRKGPAGALGASAPLIAQISDEVVGILSAALAVGEGASRAVPGPPGVSAALPERGIPATVAAGIPWTPSPSGEDYRYMLFTEPHVLGSTATGCSQRMKHSSC